MVMQGSRERRRRREICPDKDSAVSRTFRCEEVKKK